MRRRSLPALGLAACALLLAAVASPGARAQIVALGGGAVPGVQSDRAPTVGAIYPWTRTHSPITAEVAAHLRETAGRSRLEPNVFAKVGASATVNRNYLRCFAGPHVELGGRGHLTDTLTFFNAPGTNPFRRRSEAAGVGWNAGRAIRGGSDSPIAREVRAIDPRFALATYGTNDLELRRPVRYARTMERLLDLLEVRGVVPLLLTTMPRDDSADSDHRVGLYNAILRALAQGRQVPLIDHYRELAPLPDHGLASDGVHPNVHFVNGQPRGCDFGVEGLQHGYNLRNLVALEALDRARRVVVDGEAPPDPEPAPEPSGRGSHARPFEVAALPFSHASSTARSPFRALDAHEGCDRTRFEGPEVVYRFTLTTPTAIEAVAYPAGDSDLGLSLFDDDGLCLEHDRRRVGHELPAGTYRFVIDSRSTQQGTFYFALDRVDRRSENFPRRP